MSLHVHSNRPMDGIFIKFLFQNAVPNRTKNKIKIKQTSELSCCRVVLYVNFVARIYFFTNSTSKISHQFVVKLTKTVTITDALCYSSIVDFLCTHLSQLLSTSLYFSKRGAYWDRLCRDVVGRWLVVTRVHRGQTVHPIAYNYGTLIVTPTPKIQWYKFRPLGWPLTGEWAPREALFVKLLWQLVQIGLVKKTAVYKLTQVNDEWVTHLKLQKSEKADIITHRLNVNVLLSNITFFCDFCSFRCVTRR